MIRGAFIALLLTASPIMANDTSTTMPSTMMDVAPTTLELKPGVPGLFYVTNHGDRPVTVQIEAADWTQAQGRDLLAPSGAFFASPPFATLAPGARQTVRVMARPSGGGEHVYRLLVSELPDATEGAGVHVLLQFSVPVFVRAAPPPAPQLTWSSRGGVLSATNSGGRTVKLTSLTLDGAVRDTGLVYLLPGATRSFGAVGRAGQVRVHDGLSGAELAADVAP
ncbi:MAG TPA: fimbria/pilus periplasmic chaperone [Rhizomicrobium sp.]